MRYFTGLVFVLMATFANAKEIRLKNSKINNVTVFLRGAEINRSASFSLGPGTSKIIFEEVGNGIQLNSIQAKGRGDFTIMEVKHGREYKEVKKQKDLSKTELRIETINDSLITNKFLLDDIALQEEALLGEKNIILGKSVMQNAVDSFPIFKEYISFYRQELTKINKQLIALRKQKHQLNAERRELSSRKKQYQKLLKSNNRGITKRVNTITVTVSANKYVNGRLNIKYTIPNAGWKPMYDVRIDEKGSTSKLVYKAKVHQRTGVDWKGVKLTLSTSNPSQKFYAPVLRTNYLDYYREFVRDNYERKKKYKNKEMAKLAIVADASIATVEESDDAGSELVSAKSSISLTDVKTNMLDVEYSIKLKYDIPQDGIEHLVFIHEENIKTNFRGLSVPKISNKTYSMARLVGWEKLELVPGAAQIFFDGTYVGETSIDPYIIKDTLDVVLGIDKKVVVNRKHVKTEEKESLTGSKITKTYTFNIEVKNNNTRTTSIDLLDQIPVSKRKDIEVNLIDRSKATFSKKDGKLSWELILKPGEVKNFTVKFSVKTPKDKKISGMNGLALR